MQEERYLTNVRAWIRNAILSVGVNAISHLKTNEVFPEPGCPTYITGRKGVGAMQSRRGSPVNRQCAPKRQAGAGWTSTSSGGSHNSMSLASDPMNLGASGINKLGPDTNQVGKQPEFSPMTQLTHVNGGYPPTSWGFVPSPISMMAPYPSVNFASMYSPQTGASQPPASVWPFVLLTGPFLHATGYFGGVPLTSPVPPHMPPATRSQPYTPATMACSTQLATTPWAGSVSRTSL